MMDERYELTAACARALGMSVTLRYCIQDECDQWFERQTWEEATSRASDMSWQHKAKVGFGALLPCVANGAEWDVVPAYAESDVAARLLENEIERRGLQHLYIGWLIASTSGCSDTSDHHWALMHATPEQRARAFLEAVKETA